MKLIEGDRLMTLIMNFGLIWYQSKSMKIKSRYILFNTVSNKNTVKII
jgi:hypothetical protein